MADTFTATSTGVEILVQIPPQMHLSTDTSDIPEGSSTSIASPVRAGLKFRSGDAPKRTLTSDLECGGPSELPSSSGDPDDPRRPAWRFLVDTMQNMLLLGIWVLSFAWIAFLFLSGNLDQIFFVFLLCRPQAIAVELAPLFERARNCRDEASPLACPWDRHPLDESLPRPLLELRESWGNYLEEKIKEWRGCTTVVVFLSAFALCIIQIPDRNDPTTRVLAYVTFSVMFFCLLVTRGFFPSHLDNKNAKDVHFAYHFLQHAEDELTSIWNIHVLLSMSTASTGWVTLLSISTFACVYYNDTKTTGTSDEVIPLRFWQMVLARVVMVALLLATVLCLIWMHVTLKKYGDAVKHAHPNPLPDPSPVEAELQERGSDAVQDHAIPILTTAEPST
ncbi:hypothetical protein DFH07DRAFT_1062865 [Mycena maculata]|uniref:Transmembrane protein n=1 Tax=Mycena maculata TaxID=230809 RepID=A0AAD7IN28_9AGAR|nr:hypothetical protein DFH07DRAFT_1062865 [Mycena maculata]